jgi:hypothetical protein
MTNHLARWLPVAMVVPPTQTLGGKSAWIAMLAMFRHVALRLKVRHN